MYEARAGIDEYFTDYRGSNLQRDLCLGTAKLSRSQIGQLPSVAV